MRDHGFRALALLADAGVAENRPGRVEPHRGAVLRRDARAADAIERGARIGHLDEARKADAAIDALFAEFLLLGAQACVVHHRVEMGQRLVMRQRLELDAGRSLRGMRVVGNEIAPPDLQRVHADPLRRHLDQAFGHGSRDRMADRAVLAHYVLVLEHDAGARLVVAAGVGPAGQVHHLVRLDARGARIDRIGADAGEVVDLPGRDGAVLLDADPGLHAMVARMNVGDEALDPVGDEFYGSLEQLRQRHRRHLVSIGVHLDAERAADVLGDDADLVLLQVQVLGEQVLHHVRRLRALVHGHALLAGIPVGDDRAGLVADAGVAAEHERGLDHLVGLGEALVGIARDMHALEGEVVAQLGMDHRRLRIERGLRIGDGRELLIIDLNQLAAVLGFGAAARHHGADRFAGPAGTVDRDGVLRRGLDALQMRQHADPGGDDLGKLRAGDDGDHARRFLRRVRIDAFDFRVGMRRAHERHMRHARQHHVADILRAALHQPRHIGPRHRAADIGVRPVERGEDGRGVVDYFHHASPLAPVRSLPRIARRRRA